MLGVVKKPHIELSISGEGAEAIIEWIKQKFDLQIISGGNDKINIEKSDFYREMNNNRIGNLLEAARLRARLTQKQLSEKIGIRQNMLSDYEKGKRKLTRSMAQRLANELQMKVERLETGSD
jgi:ribosome-binding protein aMBF1 (putative translation factor)